MRSAKAEVGGFFVTLALTLAACAGSQPRAATQRSGPSATTLPTLSASGALDREHLEAQAALDRWASAVSKAGGPPWFSVAPEYKIGLAADGVGAGLDDNAKVALYAGALNADPELPDSAPADADVHWADGVARTLPLVSPRDALAELKADGNGQCGACRPLIVTGARLSTTQVPTSRGEASVPVWEFTLQGSPVRVTYVAVSPAATAEVEPHAGAGLRIDSATLTRNGRRLTVNFTGSPGQASQPCGADYDGEAVESPLAVVVIVHKHPYVDPDPSAAPIICAAVGALRMATVELGQPLGDRAVLDLQDGIPVPVTLTN